MPHPSVSELLAIGDGAPDAALAAHLAECASCRRLTERAQPVARAEEIARGEVDLHELPAVDPALYLRLERLPEQRGGMGRTFVARDRRLGREVTIKQPLGPADVPDPLLRATLRARFEREARLTARLEHPAIVGVYEAGRFRDGEAFYAMRRVQGRSLTEVIASLPGLADRLALLPNLTIVAEALAYAHSRGVIHRDVTPANILVGAFGETVLIDWGLAAEAATAHDGTLPADVYRRGEIALTDYGVGTPGYVAPEQVRGNAPDAAADIFGLGATLYHLLAGRAPTPGTTDVRAGLGGEVPPPLVALVARAMAERPGERFASAVELAAELRRFHAGQLMASHRYTPRELLRHYLRRYRAPIAIAAIAIAVLIAGGALYVRGLARSRDRIERARAAAEASDRAAQAALRRQRGVTASQLAANPARRLEAIAEGVRAVGPALRAGVPVAPEAWQGLVDALAAGPVGAPLIGHHGALNAAAFLHGGTELLTAGPDHTLRRWAVPSGLPRAVLPSRLARPNQLVVAPDGARALACGYDALAELVPLDGSAGREVPLPMGDPQCRFTPAGEAVIAAGAQVQVLAATDAAVVAALPLPANATALGISPDGLIAIGTVAGDLVLWRPGAAPTVRPAAHPGSLQLATFLDDGARLVTGGDDGRVLGWPVRGDLLGAPTVVSDRPGTLMPSVTALPAGRLAISAAHSLTRRHDGVTMIVGGAAPITIADFAVAPASGVATTAGLAGMSPDGGALFDPATGRALLRLPRPADVAHGALRDADELLVISMDGGAMLWDVRSGGPSGALLGHAGEVTALIGLGDRLWSASIDGTVRVWSTTSAEARALDLGTELVGATAAPDGRRLALVGADGTVRLVATTGAPSARALAVAGAALAFAAFAPDGARLLTGTTGGRAQLWDAATGALGPTLTVPGDLTAGAFTPDGTGVVVGSADGTLTTIDLATGAVRATRATAATGALLSGGDAIDQLRFAADGSLVVGFASARTMIVDGPGLAPRGARDGRPVAALPDGRLVVLTVDGQVVVDGPAGGAPQILAGGARSVLAVAAAPDGAWVATADQAGVIRVFDLASGAAALTLAPAGMALPTALTFLDGGRALAIGGAGGALRIVPLDPARAVAQGCALLGYFDRADDACAGAGAITTSPNQTRSRAPR